VVEEALANVREHSGATSVQVSVRRENGTLQLSVADNGRGFDVTRAMRRASRDRRLGPIALQPRLRLRGAQLAVNSRPGAPTVISGSLPAWKPNGSASGVAPIGPAVNSREGKR
jgi:two-component system sensor histidine kinase UhpB